MDINWRKPRLSKAKRLKVIADYNDGVKVTDIEDKYKISKMTVYRILREKAD